MRLNIKHKEETYTARYIVHGHRVLSLLYPKLNTFECMSVSLKESLTLALAIYESLALCFVS